MTSPEFTFAALRRHPDVEAPNLFASDATDRLVLDEAAGPLGVAPPETVAVIGDHYGALTLGAAALHGTTAIRTHQDRLTGERALAANAERLDLTHTFTSHALGSELLAGAGIVLLQLPRSLDALDEIAAAIAAHADPAVQVVAGGRVKYMTRAMNDVLGRYFDRVGARLARQKSRVLVASEPRPASAAPITWPATAHHGDLGLTVYAHGGVFAGTQVDIGTRFLLQLVDRMAPEAALAVDLGCGTGVLAVALARARPDLRIIATDESAAAVASATATARANGVTDRVTTVRDDAASSVGDGDADLVVLNPPFHAGAAVQPGVATRLFADAGRVLRPGGELWAVWNSHLQHRPALERLVGPTRQVDRNAKFTVTVSTKA